MNLTGRLTLPATSLPLFRGSSFVFDFIWLKFGIDPGGIAKAVEGLCRQYFFKGMLIGFVLATVLFLVFDRGTKSNS